MTAANDNQPDLLLGAQAIASFLGVTRRQAFHLIHKGVLPSFKAGASVAARRSSLRKWMDEAEQAGRAA